MSSIEVDNVGQPELTMLENLTETDVNTSLKTRFDQGKIYSSIGSVVVSINPYTKYDIYGQEFIKAYERKYQFELPPHIYAVANNAYREMKFKAKDQCIIISGESGAGKTESSKLVMKFVAAVSNAHGVDKIKEKLLSSNPILEALGNAKTIRNDNSSRFGKYMDLQFDVLGNAMGGQITTYLLEKARVVNQNPGERSFHIFYQLLKSGDDQLLKDLKLTNNPLDYKYLKNYTPEVSKGINDKEDFKEVTNAMKSIGITPDQQKTLFEVLAAILHLGNIEFADLPKSDLGCSTASEASALSVQIVSELLGLTPEGLLKALTTKIVRDMKKVGEKNDVSALLTAERASYVRHALSKGLYERFFGWFIKLINQQINYEPHSDCTLIGVLDIYGFENFQKNGFEQFCINYTNERLQQVFIQLILKSEQDEYDKEGLQWVPVDYFNNQFVVSLIEGKPKGIISLLDEECLRPGDVSDKTFLSKLNQVVSSSTYFDSKEKSPKDQTLTLELFRIQHYAGNVNYNIEGFLDKNMDLLSKDLLIQLNGSSKRYFSEVFPENGQNADLKRPESLGTQFRSSIQQLMDNLLAKMPHYIRCIKPNLLKQAGRYDDDLVINQIRYLGLIENIKVKRAGYCYRLQFEKFNMRFKILSEKTWPRLSGNKESDCVEILSSCGIQPSEYTLGKTKIFIKGPKTVILLEESREKGKVYVVNLIRRNYLAFIHRKKYQMMKKSALKIQSVFRMYCKRRDFVAVMKFYAIVTKLAKGFVQRKRYRLLLARQPHRAGPMVKKFILNGFRKRYLLALRSAILKAGKRFTKVKQPKTLKFFASAGEFLTRTYRIQQCSLYRKNVKAVMPILSRFIIFAATKVSLKKHAQAVRVSKNKFKIEWPKTFTNFQEASQILRRTYFKILIKRFKNASKIFSRCYISHLKKKFLLVVLMKAVTDRKGWNIIVWPTVKFSNVKELSQRVREFYFTVEARKFRKSLSLERKELLELKFICSEAFKTKKAEYQNTVSVPFVGKYLNLKEGKIAAKWDKINSEKETDTMSFEVQKFHRSSAGKYVSRGFVLTNKSLVIVDFKSFSLKDKILLSDICKVTLSETADGAFVLHFKESKKGDCMYRANDICKAMEMAARIKQANKSCELACSMEVQMKIFDKNQNVTFDKAGSLISLNQSTDSLQNSFKK